MAETITVKIVLPDQTKHMIDELKRFPGAVPFAIKRGLDRAVLFVVGKIQAKRLSGTGPYPVADHRVGERSGFLRRAARSTPSIIQGTTVIAAVGAFVTHKDFNYALTQEYGAVIRGNPFLKFKVGDKVVVTRKSVIPARAPFQTEIELPQTAKTISTEIANEIKTAFDNL